MPPGDEENQGNNLPEAGLLTQRDDFSVFGADIPMGSPEESGDPNIATGTTDRGATANATSQVVGRHRADTPRQRVPRPPVTFETVETIRLDTIDPAKTAEQRAAEEAAVAFDRQSGLQAADFGMQQANVRMQGANVLAQQINEEESRLAAAEQEHDRALNELNELNRGVMEQRIDPARFFTDNRGAGLSAAASVALGVLGQGLNPNLQNTAMVIIDRAINRDIEAQIANLQNQQQGVALQRNLYGDLLRTYESETAAREALRGMYTAEVERRIQALGERAVSAATARRAEALVHALRLRRANAAVDAARARRTVVYTSRLRNAQRPGQLRGARQTAATIQGNMPLTETAMAQENQERGFLRTAEQGQAQGQAAPGQQLPAQQERITTSDLRRAGRQGRRGSRMTARQAATTANRQARQAQGEAAPIGRRSARSLYRGGIVPLNGVVPQLRAVPPPAGAQGVTLYGFNTGESRPTGERAGATQVDVMIPVRAPGGVVVSNRAGETRVARFGEALNPGERVLGQVWREDLKPQAASDAQTVRAMTGTVPAGNDFFVTQEGVQRFGGATNAVFERELRDFQGSMALHRAASEAIRLLNQYEDEESPGMIDVRFFGTQRTGAQGVNVMAMFGNLASSGSLGTLQQGERQALDDYTQLVGEAEAGLIREDHREQLRGAAMQMQRAAIANRDENLLSSGGYIRRRTRADDVRERHGAQ